MLSHTHCVTFQIRTVVLFVIAMAFHKPLSSAEPRPDDRTIISNASTQQDGVVTISGHVCVYDDAAQSSTKLKGVHQAVVYLDSPDVLYRAKEATVPFVVTAKAGKLNPKHACIVVGQTLSIQCLDEDDYNFAVNAPGELFFSDPLPKDPKRFDVAFSKPHNFAEITCGIHQGLKGIITVVPNPIIASTSKDGHYSLSHAFQPGKYRFTAIHPEHGRATKDIEIIPKDHDVTIEFVLPR